MVHNALEPLRQKGYLTTYNRQKDKIEFSAITVIITTHANVLDQVEALEPRDMFLDAPLLDISNASYMPTLSPTAHMSYLGLFGGGWTIARHRERIRKLVSEAHAKGIMVRIWGIPNSPKWLRWVVRFTAPTLYAANIIFTLGIRYGKCYWRKV